MEPQDNYGPDETARSSDAARALRLLSRTQPCPPELALVDIVAEIAEWLEYFRQNAWARNRASLRRELEASINVLMPSLLDALEDNLRRFADAAAVVLELPHPDAAARHSAKLAGRVLLTVLQSPHVVEAAFDDLLVGLGSADSAGLAVARSQMLSLIEHAGHDRWALSRLQSVVADDALAVAEVQRAFGDKTRDDSAQPHEAAGLTLEERVSLVRRYISAPPGEGRCVAWMSYTGRLHTFVQQLGPVTIFDARWAVPNARTAEGQKFPHRPEMIEVLRGLPQDFPRDADVLLVRIDLGRRRRAQAMQHARDVAALVIGAAAILGDGLEWRLEGHEMLVVDGALNESSMFDPNADRYGTVWDSERTEIELSEVGAGLAMAVAGADIVPSSTADAVRSALEAAGADSRSKIVLEARVLEMVAASAGMTADELRAALLRLWPGATVGWEVHRSISAVLHRLKERDVVLAIQQWLRGGAFRIDLGTAAEHLETLRKAVGEDPNDRWIGDGLALLSDSGRATSRFESADRECRLVAARLRRVRNAIVHGNPVSTPALRSVASLSDWLAKRALRYLVVSQSTGRAIRDQLERDHRHARQVAEHVESGDSYAASVLRSPDS